MPSRSYVFHESKPQVDHIFPVNLPGGDETYQHAVDVLWNFQPVPAEVNNYKLHGIPRSFSRARMAASIGLVMISSPNLMNSFGMTTLSSWLTENRRCLLP